MRLASMGLSLLVKGSGTRSLFGIAGSGVGAPGTGVGAVSFDGVGAGVGGSGVGAGVGANVWPGGSGVGTGVGGGQNENGAPKDPVPNRIPQGSLLGGGLLQQALQIAIHRVQTQRLQHRLQLLHIDR